MTPQQAYDAYLAAHAALSAARATHITATAAYRSARLDRDAAGDAVDSAEANLRAATTALFVAIGGLEEAPAMGGAPATTADAKLDRLLLLLEQVVPALAQIATNSRKR